MVRKTDLHSNYLASIGNTNNIMQNAYNYILDTKKIIPTKDIIHADDIIEFIYLNNIHVAITRKIISTLASKGNNNAIELNKGYNKTISLEDLSQEFILACIKNKNTIQFDKENIIFTDNVVFKAISNYLYKFRNNANFTSLETIIDSELVDIQIVDNNPKKVVYETNQTTKAISYKNVKSLSSYVDICNDTFVTDLETITKTLETNLDSKYLDMAWEYINLRLQGLSYKDCYETMKISKRQLERLIERIKFACRKHKVVIDIDKLEKDKKYHKDMRKSMLVHYASQEKDKTFQTYKHSTYSKGTLPQVIPQEHEKVSCCYKMLPCYDITVTHSGHVLIVGDISCNIKSVSSVNSFHWTKLICEN